MRIHLRHRQRQIEASVERQGDEILVQIGGRTRRVRERSVRGNERVIEIDGRVARVRSAVDEPNLLSVVGGYGFRFAREGRADAGHTVEFLASPEVVAPMPGKVTRVFVEAGDRVEAGDPLLVLEAMKMENRLTAEAAGTVAEIAVEAGTMVDGGQVLVRLTYD